jgi:hypothetical protein
MVVAPLTAKLVNTRPLPELADWRAVTITSALVKPGAMVTVTDGPTVARSVYVSDVVLSDVATVVD